MASDAHNTPDAISAVETSTVETVAGTHAAPHGGGDHAYNPLEISWPMFFWFLVVFVIAGVILKKFAWGPILESLDQRESTIKKALDDADKLKSELAELEATRASKIAAADTAAAEILEHARKGAVDASRTIEGKARENAQIMLENAQREIGSSRDKAAAELRKNNAELAVALAGRIIGENLDNDKNRALTDRLIQEL